jgi:hypothetical protein
MGAWIAFGTNGTLKPNGEVVMGAGVALHAKTKFPVLPKELGAMIGSGGNHVWPVHHLRILSFPVKHNFWNMADPDLLLQSCKELLDWIPKLGIDEVYMVRPGVGNGRLPWDIVKPLISRILDDRVVIVSWP